ncbi:alpha/beta hydrolase family protein [Flavitalea antarctica]
MKLFRVYIACMVVFCTISNTTAQYFEIEILPGTNDQFKKAKYRIWLPEGVRQIRGVIVRQHGCGLAASSKGLDYANDLQWQALAKKFDMALLGTQLENYENCAQWFDTESGSERAFLAALKELSVASSHPEIEMVPWALYGHSGGAYWCTNMLFKYPERILVVINRSGGISSSKWVKKVIGVPVLWVAGEFDIVDGLDYVKALTIKSFGVYRKFGAPWSVAIDPKAGHENRQGRSFYIPYMDAMLSLRLPAEGYKCKLINVNNGWLGNWKSKEIFSFTPDTIITDYCWFPDLSTAEKWKEFITSGSVNDNSPPPAPYAVHTITLNKETYLEWSSPIDLETGIKQFNVYKNNQLFGSFSGQTPNHGDVAQPVIDKFRMLIKGEKGVFAVTSVNHQHAESIRSQEININ